jgi:inorganic pyrophosphatase
MVVEWSKGSPFRYAWKEGHLALVAVDQPAPVNYGLIPGLINPADGEEVDAVFLGPPLSPGSEVEGEVVGMVWLLDGDHKLILANPPAEVLPDLGPLLGWFQPDRKPTFVGLEGARTFLRELGLDP